MSFVPDYSDSGASDSDGGEPAAPRAAKPARTSGKGIASLVLGILSIAACLTFLAGIPAITLGKQALAEIRRSRGRLTGEALAKAGIATGGIGSTLMVLAVVLLVSGAMQASLRRESSNNLTWIALALQNFRDRKKTFPAAATHDEAGNPLLSWRVALLPFLSELRLFEKFNQDERWNGPTNETWAAIKYSPYYSPSAVDRRSPGETNILGIVGRETVLTPSGGILLRDVSDGPSQTIIAAELAGSGIVWSEPRDITIDEFIAAMRRQPTDQGLRPCYADGAFCIFADGKVHFVPADTTPEMLRALCTRDGGEAVETPKLD